ncbi:MAG: hypothetical protein KAJ95_02850, partial [Gammaproteobacteria bacterium]|nr:hypothetical protein [Gammaproteobacteria bacterium]
KLPWPFDIAHKHPVEQIQQVNIGFVEDPQDRLLGKPLLWGQEHYIEEFNLLVATSVYFLPLHTLQTVLSTSYEGRRLLLLSTAPE